MAPPRGGKDNSSPPAGVVHEAGGGSYQTLMNEALREHIQNQGLEVALRRVVREELRRFEAG